MEDVMAVQDAKSIIEKEKMERVKKTDEAIKKILEENGCVLVPTIILLGDKIVPQVQILVKE